MEIASVRRETRAGCAWVSARSPCFWAIYAAITITGAMGSVEPLGTPVADLVYCAVLLGAGVLCLVRAAPLAGRALGVGHRRRGAHVLVLR